MRRPLLGVLLLVALLGACGSEAVRPLSGIRRDPPLVARNVSLPEVAPGSGVRSLAASSPDGLTVLYFGYTHCPDLCPSTFAALRTALKDVEGAERIEVAFVTVDPDRDTSEVMSGYLSSFFGDRWVALRTEDEEQLMAAEEPFLASSSVETTFDGRISVSHTGTTYVVDHSGNVLVEWGFPTAPEDMSGDLSQLLKEIA